MPNVPRKDVFSHLARKSARAAGHPWAFGAAIAVLLVWLISGPFFGFSDTWQLVINTATTIVTFLMVFLIQNTQNRDIDAIHIKLDELILKNRRAQNALLMLEELTEDELLEIKERYAKKARDAGREGRADHPGADHAARP